MSDITSSSTATSTPMEGVSDTSSLEQAPKESNEVSTKSNEIEGYSEWLKRQSKKDEKSEKAPLKVVKPEDSSDQKQETEQVVTPKIKIKDKEYETAELEKVMEEHGVAASKIKDFEDHFKQVDQNIEKMIDMIKTDPRTLFDRMEVPKEVIEKYYYEKYIEPNTLSAEQKLERYEKADKEKREKEVQDTKAKEDSDRVEHFKGQWRDKIAQTLKEGGLPETDWIVSRMAGYMKQAIDKKLYHVGPSDVVKFVKEDLKNLQKATLGNLTPEQIAETLGEEVIQKIRENETKKFSQGKFDSKVTSQPKVERKPLPGKKITNIYDLLE